MRFIKPQLKMRRHGRWLVQAADWLVLHTCFRIPRPLFMWVYSRAWLLSRDGGVTWASVRLAPNGQVLA